MTPEYLNELADLVDPEKLWCLSGIDQKALPPEKRRQLDAGVALRRQAAHVRDVRALLGTGKSLLITPLSLSGTARMKVETPAKHLELLAVRGARAP